MQQEQSTLLSKQAYLTALYQRYAPALFAYLHRHTGSLEDTEDLLLDVFEAALVRPGFERLATQEQEAWLWNMSTYQVVFKQTLGKFSPGVIHLGDQLVWQPHSDNLALAEGVAQGQDASSIALWDVAHHTLIKRFTQHNTNLLTWSPDGKYLAFVVQTMHVDMNKRPAQVTLEQEVLALDVQSGQRTVVLHEANATTIAVIAWSPDGKYIATGPSGWPAPIQVIAASA